MRPSRCFTRSLGLAYRQCHRRRYSTAHDTSQNEVRIVEVGPRDGLQNEPKGLDISTKMELIRRLSSTGLKSIEAGSFVSPKWVPQMSNSDNLLKQLLSNPPPAPHPIDYNFLVPNLKGLDKFIKVRDEKAQHQEEGRNPWPTTYPPQDPKAPPAPDQPTTSARDVPEPAFTSAFDPNDTPTTYPPQDPDLSPSTPESPPSLDGSTEPAPITSSADPNQMPSSANAADKGASSPKSDGNRPETDISIFLAATEAFSQANTNCSMAESIERSREILARAKEHSLSVRAYISVALGCPYEGPAVPPQRVAELARTLLEMGVDEVSVADTTGMGTAPKTQELLKALTAAGVSAHDLALHFHDTYGQALINVCVGLEHGVRVFDSAVGGLGGCPFSKGATGNLSTEDLLHCLHSLGIHTGVDEEEMSRIGDWISQQMGRPNESRAGKAVLARLKSKS